jgi:serine/threonine protein kinase/ABC-type phosphate transport system substrate-binding protein
LVAVPFIAAGSICLPFDLADDASMLPATPTKTLLFEGSALGGAAFDAVASAYVLTVDDVTIQRLTVDAATAIADYDSGRSDAALLAAQVPRSMPGHVQLPVAAYGVEIIYTFAGGPTMAIFDGLPLFASVWSGAITRWDDPALGANSGATPDMLPAGPIRIAVERFRNGSIESEAASLSAVFGQALASADPTFASAYAAHGSDLSALVLATAGINRTLLIDPVAWSEAVPTGTTPPGPVYDPATGARLFDTVEAALASGDGVIGCVVAGNTALAHYARPLLTNRAGRLFFQWTASATHAALNAYGALTLREIPYDTGVPSLSNSEGLDAWPIVGLVTAVLRSDASPASYDCQYAKAALDFFAWLQINDGALAATLTSGTLVPLTSDFRQRATDTMGAVSRCETSSASSSSAVAGSALERAVSQAALNRRDAPPTVATSNVIATARVAATALVGAGTTSLIWSSWMQAYASRIGGAGAARLKLAEDGEDEAVARLASYGVDFAVTSSDVDHLSPVLAAACTDCLSLPVAVRPFAAVYNVPEIARAPVPLLLDASLLAGIVSGRIDSWNHTRIVEANPLLADLLPGRPIIVALAKGGSASGAGGPLGGIANRFAAEYMAADPTFRVEVLNGSSTTANAVSIVYPIEVAAPARVLMAGDRVALAIKATPYSVGVDALEAAIAARNPSLADLRDALGNRVSPTSEAVVLAVGDFVTPDFVARVPAQRGALYAPVRRTRRAEDTNAASSSSSLSSSSSFATLPRMMVGAATAGAWPIAGWHYSYLHRETTPDCAKAVGLVDALYWTQTSDDGATVATAQGLATSSYAVGVGATARLISALANVTCATASGERFQVLSVAPCLYVAPDAVDPAAAITVCANHGQCVLGGSTGTPTAPGAASTSCSCASGWTGTHCQTAAHADSGPGSHDDGISTSLVVGLVVGVAVPVCCVMLLVVALVVALTIVRHRTARRRALDTGCEIDLDEISIMRTLGKGATSEVCEGVWRSTRVAVKRFNRPDRGWDRAALANFSEEVRVMCALRHPHVVMFMGASTRPPVLAIVMEHMALGSLRDVLDNELLVQIPFKLKATIAQQTAKGMHFLHSAGISHGDLKSLNILITEKWQAKVSDFGLSSVRNNGGDGGDKMGRAVGPHVGGGALNGHAHQHNLGTVHWAAPERILWASGGQETDVQAGDVYSFGVVLWELLTRDKPYRGCGPAAVQVVVMRDGMRPDAYVARAALAAEGVETFDASAYEPHDDITAAVETEAMPESVVASYVGLYRACWQSDPAARPTFLGALGELGNLLGRIDGAQPYGASDSSSSSNTHYQNRTLGITNGGSISNRDGAEMSRTTDTLTGASGSEATDGAGGGPVDLAIGGGGTGLRKPGRAPDGAVVIALADVAHATTLWETVPMAMSAATVTFVETLRRLTIRYGGHEAAQVGRTTASLFCAMFVDPCAAVAWAAAAQRLLASDETTWPPELLACPEAAAEYSHTASTADIESGRARPVYRGLCARMTLHYGQVRRVACDVGRRPEYDGPGLQEALRLTPRVRGGHVLVTEAMCSRLMERPRAVVERCLGMAGRIERAAGGISGDSRARQRARFAAGAADIISAVDHSPVRSDSTQNQAALAGGTLSVTLRRPLEADDNGGDTTLRDGAEAWSLLDSMLRTSDEARQRRNRLNARLRRRSLDGDDRDNNNTYRIKGKGLDRPDDDDDDNEDSSSDDNNKDQNVDSDASDQESGLRVRPLLCQLRVAQLDGRWTDHVLLSTTRDADVTSIDDDGARHTDAGPSGDVNDDDERDGNAGASAWGDGRRAELAYVDSANMCRAVINPRTLIMGRVIGSGSFATVYRANWQGTTVAVKRLARSRLTERDIYHFRAEVILHARLEHPNVLPLFGACLQEGNLCLVTEYMPHGTLRSLLGSTEGGRLGWDVRLRMLRHVARGVAYLHDRSPAILHRDLKPANLLVANGNRIVVADFGLARVKEEGATMTASRGTLAYAAPEVLLGREHTEKSDVYAMGLIMWSVLTRREPFADRGARDTDIYTDIIGGTRPQVPSDSPPEFVALMARCWNNNPNRRPTMQAVVDGLTVMIGDAAAGIDLESGLV